MDFPLWRDRLTLLALVLLPWQGRYIKEPAELVGVPWEQGTASLYALEIVILAALICQVLAASVTGPDTRGSDPKARGRFARRPPPLTLQLAALLVLYAFLSIFWGFDTIAGLFGWFRLFEGFALAYLLWSSSLSLAQAVGAFLAGAAMAATLGLQQFLSQSTFASTLFGLASHVPSEPGTAVVETATGRFLRAYGPFPHPNVFGGYMAAAWIAAAGLHAGAEGQRTRFAALAAGLLAAAGLVVSFSRSAWIAAAAAALVVGWSAPRRGAASGRLRRFAVASALILAAGLVLAWPLVAARVGAQGRLELRSVDERARAFAAGWEVFRSRPGSGAGVGNMMPAVFLDVGGWEDPYAVQPPHFVPLLVAAELGFFGVAVLLAVAWAWWLEARPVIAGSTRPLRQAAVALPLVIAVVGLFDHYPWSLFPGLMLTGFAAGVFLKAVDAVSGGNQVS